MNSESLEVVIDLKGASIFLDEINHDAPNVIIVDSDVADELTCDACDDEDFVFIGDEEIGDTSRWSVYKNRVVWSLHQKAFYEVIWEEGATESQDVEHFQDHYDENGMVKLYKVTPYISRSLEFK